VSLNAAAISEDELKSLLNSSEASHNKKELRMRNNQMHTVLPPIAMPEPPAAIPNATTKKPRELGSENVEPSPPLAIGVESGKSKPVASGVSSSPGLGGAAKPPVTAQGSASSTARCDPSLPPSWCKVKDSQSVKPKTTINTKATVVFGITKGITLRGRLERVATNADADEIEILLTQNFEGDLRQLPEGTILFGSKVFNAGTKRLDVLCKSGITPDGFEFDDVRIYVRDENMRSGLIGVITADKDIVARAAASGTNAVITGAVSNIAKTNLIGSAISSTAGSLSDQSNEVIKDKVGRLENVITVNPTNLKLYVGKTF